MCFKGRLHIAHFYSRLFSLRKIKSLAALVLDTHPLLLMHPGGHKNSPEWVLRKIQSVCERVMSRKNGWKEKMSQQWLVEKDGNCLSVIFKFNCTRNWGWRVGGKAGQICSAWSIVSTLFSSAQATQLLCMPFATGRHSGTLSLPTEAFSGARRALGHLRSHIEEVCREEVYKITPAGR